MKFVLRSLAVIVCIRVVLSANLPLPVPES